MMILSLMFLFFIGINLLWNSSSNKMINEYMSDIEKELSEELKIIK